MACGCNKNPMRNTGRGSVVGPIRNAVSRPVSQNISIQSILPPNPSQVPNPTPINQVAMDEERRRIEKLRRDAIRKALNK
jgi:hypothetical protein